MKWSAKKRAVHIKKHHAFHNGERLYGNFDSVSKESRRICVRLMKMSPLTAVLICSNYERGYYSNESEGEAEVTSSQDGGRGKTAPSTASFSGTISLKKAFRDPQPHRLRWESRFRSKKKYRRRILDMLKTKCWCGTALRTSLQSHSPN